MRLLIVVLSVLLSVGSAIAQVSIGISMPGVSIGINVPAYPQLVPVPGYPVYYAPRLRSNFFFYDGMYWVYRGDTWYASAWYNGPWGIVAPEFVPVFILRVPVRYYRDPPGHFRGWKADAPPRWGQHWGHEWEQHRRGWDRWDRRSAPTPAPLPVYQRRYSGDRYPALSQQPELHARNYRYQPREPVVKQHYEAQAIHPTRAPAQRVPQRPQVEQGHWPPERAGAPTRQDRSPGQDVRRQPHEGAAQSGQQVRQSAAKNAGRGQGASGEPGRGHGVAKEREKGQERGREPNR